MGFVKKFVTGLAICAVLVLPFEAMGAETVIVSSRVGDVNIPATINALNPSDWVLIVAADGSSQLVFDFSDPNDTTVTYTVTPEPIPVGDSLYDLRNSNTGSVSVESGSVNDVTSAGSSDVQTNYLAPSTTGYLYVTVTANDGESVSSRKFTVYVY